MHGQTDYVLIDTQDNEIIASGKITPAECAKRNDEARSVGEIFLQWQPAHLFICQGHNVQHHRTPPQNNPWKSRFPAFRCMRLLGIMPGT